jgi:hypothetical protein
MTNKEDNNLIIAQNILSDIMEYLGKEMRKYINDKDEYKESKIMNIVVPNLIASICILPCIKDDKSINRKLAKKYLLSLNQKAKRCINTSNVEIICEDIFSMEIII